MFQQNLYDAFTGISFSEKNAIVQFLQKNLENSWVEKTAILKAVEYATKEIPSFGGFVLTAEKNEEIVAALIVNRTGLSGLMPEYVTVLQATKPIAKVKVIARKLVEKAVTLAQGDIANLIMDFGPKELLLEDLAPAAKLMPIQTKVEKQVKATA
ncbi:MAG: hypothetical protein AB8G86_16630 [Saprospiraceae bacterium]